MQKPLITNIIVAISGSGASVHAAKYAIMLAKHNKCRLTAVYVVDTDTICQLASVNVFVREESSDYEQNLTANGKRYLSFVDELSKARGVKIETELRTGAVCTEIVNAAAEKKADLIILGGWEKDREPQDIISNIHRNVMIEANCSVLISKEPLTDQMYRQI
ncbi:universal stress protein [Spirochaetia bacterium]|nr:universal stress protein [Spirochaetia bacterium]